MDALRLFELKQIEGVDRPTLRAGDIVRIGTKVVEGEKTRVQSFEGTVLGIKGSGPSTSFTVRRETGKFAVERIFPLYSPLITEITIVKRQKVRRAALNYLRQAGRRRVKEDELSMQRHVKEESDKKRLAEEAKKTAEDKAEKAKKEEAPVEEPKTEAETK
ncbi:MAG: 50S ribosomal protein L19 [Candidatus Andersenbacteria bacterium]